MKTPEIELIDCETITENTVKEKLKDVDGIIVPGGFGNRGIEGKIETIKYARENKIPFLGICLGMQMLFDKSYENGEYDGLGLIKGKIRPLGDVIPKDLKIPQIGWNFLKFKNKGHPLFKYINEGDYVYFVHSYYGAECNSVIAYTEYGAPITAAVAKDNVMGCQFHPEKSGDVGLKILKAFSEWEA